MALPGGIGRRVRAGGSAGALLRRRQGERRHRARPGTAAPCHAGRPMPLVLNFGTAGSRIHPRRRRCSRAMSSSSATWTCAAWGSRMGVTPFDRVPATLIRAAFSRTCRRPFAAAATRSRPPRPMPIAACSTWRRMRSRRRAGWRARHFGCVKYVTDGADHAAADTGRATCTRQPWISCVFTAARAPSATADAAR